MPPKVVSWPRPPARPSLRTATQNPNSTTSIHFHPPSSTTAAAAAAIPSPSASVSTYSKSSVETRPIHKCNTKSTLQIPTNTTDSGSQTQSLGSPETLASKSGLTNSDMGASDGNNCKESGLFVATEKSGAEHYGPEKITRVQAASVLGNGGGSENVVNSYSVPVEGPRVQIKGSVEPVIRPEGAVVGVAGSGGKRKIVRKTVRVVKKVIKRRVPKRVLMTSSDNQGVGTKAKEGVNLSEERENMNPANNVIENTNVVDEVAEKTGMASEILSTADDLTENSNIVNDLNEKSDNQDRVTERSSIIDEVVEKEHIRDEVTRELKLENAPTGSEPIICEKGNDLSGIVDMECDGSKLNLIASFPEEMVPADNVSAINTTKTDNVKSDDVAREVKGNNLTIRASELMEVEVINEDPGTVAKPKEMVNSVMENRSKDSVVESENIDIVNKVDVALLSGRRVGLVGEKSGRMMGKANESCSEVESDHIKLTEGLLLSGEMEALERKKRRKTEIFVGGLDRDTNEDDIRKAFGQFGVIMEVRLVMSKTGKNRGYSFVRFASAADVKSALEKFPNVEICGKQCNVAPVEGNDTIFLGNIDRDWKTEDMVTLLEKAGIEKIDIVTLKADPNNTEKNRGFAFVEFQTSKDAQIAFSKLQKKEIFGKTRMVKVAWAQPLIEPAEEDILQVKSVYAEYLPSSWDEDKVKDYFKRFGEIENVVLAKDLSSSRRKDFAFINYTTRDAALTCIEAVNRERLVDDRSKVKMVVSLAKPVSKRKQMKPASDLTSKQIIEAKQNSYETSKKLHEPRKKGKAASNSYDHVKVDSRSSTTDELVQILRQQASNKHILPHPSTGPDITGHHFMLPGSKRPFSLVGHDPLYVERQGLSRLHEESSYPVSGPRSSSLGVGIPSFPYHHHQQVPGFASESFHERRVYPSHFQTKEPHPYHAVNHKYRRY